MKTVPSVLIRAIIKYPIFSLVLGSILGTLYSPRVLAQIPQLPIPNAKPYNYTNINSTTSKERFKSIPINVHPVNNTDDSAEEQTDSYIPPSSNVNQAIPIKVILPENPVATPQWAPSQINSPELKAFLDVISWAETGTIEASSYSILVFRGTFNDFSTHPKLKQCKVVNGRRLCSNAAGRYQVMGFNWDRLAPKLGLKDFSPESQDKIALYLINQKGAMPDILAGRFEQAICKVGGVWASFPCNRYDQNPKNMSQLRAIYEQQLLHYQNLVTNPSSTPDIRINSIRENGY